MILDSLKNAEQYAAIHPDFTKALKFVSENADTIPVGKYFIDADNLFVMIVETDLRAIEDCKMEAHKKYIDIQIVLSGTETFGWAELAECQSPKGDFDNEKDIIFFADKPTTLVTAKDGQFVIFFPEDVHAPLIGQGKIRKAIVKVKVHEKKLIPSEKQSDSITEKAEIELNDEQQIKFDALRQWRNDLAAARDLKPFVIASNNDLKRVAIANPQTLDDLMAVKGFKEAKVKAYGDDIVAVLNCF